MNKHESEIIWYEKILPNIPKDKIKNYLEAERNRKLLVKHLDQLDKSKKLSDRYYTKFKENKQDFEEILKELDKVDLEKAQNQASEIVENIKREMKEFEKANSQYLK